MHNLSYWLISVLTILFILILVIGLGAWIMEAGIDHVKVFSLGLSTVGLLIIALSLHRPRLLFGAVVRRQDTPENKFYDIDGAIILGLSFFIGGLLYSHYSHVGVIIGSFGAGVAIIRLRIAYLNYKYKHNL
jgi:hypothetical protein